MKKLIVFAAMSLLSLLAQAQEEQRKSPEERAKAHTERMTKQLDLNPDQVAQVEAMNLRFAQEAEAKRAARKTERDARKAEAEAMRAAHESEMKAILNSDQFARWQAMREEAKAKHKQRREERHEGK